MQKVQKRRVGRIERRKIWLFFSFPYILSQTMASGGSFPINWFSNLVMAGHQSFGCYNLPMVSESVCSWWYYAFPIMVHFCPAILLVMLGDHDGGFGNLIEWVFMDGYSVVLIVWWQYEFNVSLVPCLHFLVNKPFCMRGLTDDCILAFVNWGIKLLAIWVQSFTHGPRQISVMGCWLELFLKWDTNEVQSNSDQTNLIFHQTQTLLLCRMGSLFSLFTLFNGSTSQS
jgi:hypothetical protein